MSIFCLENISKSYVNHNGEFFALKDINLSFNSTGLVSIVGKSGSGKSTLLNILLGSEKPSSGRLIFNNKNISKMSDKTFSKYHLGDVSIIFQHYNLFEEISVIENITIPLLMKSFSKADAIKRGKEMLSKFSMSQLENRIVKTLSGGEKQRVAIIRALIISPKVILCDEPTGALDKENSFLVMETLKKISSSILVVLVSHNYGLVKRFSDRIITLKDGSVIEDRELHQCFERNNTNSKVKYSSRWTKIFSKCNLRLNKKKNIFSIISCTFGFVSIFLAFGFYSGSQASQDNALKNNLAVLHASSSIKTFFDIENSPLSYEKSIRPSPMVIEKYLDDFDSVVYEPSVDYLFSPYPYGTYQKENIENFQMVPIYDISLESFGKDLLISGSPPTSNIEEVIVNEEFVKLLHKNNEDIIDDLFDISYSVTISLSTGDIDEPFIKDEFAYNYSLRIASVVKEFSFLNTPKIYYSYPAIKRELETLYLENISEYLNTPITYYEYLLDVDNDDPLSSYSYELFINDIEESAKLFNLIDELTVNESSFQIESNAYEIKQSYKTFIESFSTALFVFVIIAFIGVNLILGMISLSTFIENKKNSAILICLGARHSSIQSIYLSENYLIVLVSIFISILLSIPIQLGINTLISNSFSLDNLITIPFLKYFGIPFILPLGISVIALLFSSIFTLVPMFIYRYISLSEELRDE